MIIGFTTFKLLIYIVYAWFAISACIISVFAIKELISMIKDSKSSTTEIEGETCYDM